MCKVNVNKLPEGTFIMSTVSSAEYNARYIGAEEEAVRRGINWTSESRKKMIDKNSKLCGKKYKITRKYISGISAKVIGNFDTPESPDNPGTIIPNILIDEVWAEKEAREIYPEFFL